MQLVDPYYRVQHTELELYLHYGKPDVCRVHNIGHTAKNLFAVCTILGTWQSNSMPCACLPDSRQIGSTQQKQLCAMRRSKRHSAKTRHTTMFLFAGCIIEAYGKVFVCHVLHLGHTAKFLFAVCFCRSTRQRFELCRVPAHSKGASPSPLISLCHGSNMHTAKVAFADACSPCSLCRVQHMTKPLP